MFETVLYEKHGPIAVVSLNRPRQVNAFNVQMRDDLWEVVDAIHLDAEVRAVILRGEGARGFCAGADLTEFGTTPSRVIAREARYARDVWARLKSLPCPTIAALHGYVLGSGVEMALCCDIRVAEEGAVFGLPEVALGMIPFAGGTQTLPRILSRAQALDLLLTGRRLDAREARSLGLVHRVVPAGDLLEAAWGQAQALLAQPRTSLERTKVAVRQGADLSLHAGLALEDRLARTGLQ